MYFSNISYQIIIKKSIQKWNDFHLCIDFCARRENKVKIFSLYWKYFFKNLPV